MEKSASFKLSGETLVGFQSRKSLSQMGTALSCFNPFLAKKSFEGRFLCFSFEKRLGMKEENSF